MFLIATGFFARVLLVHPQKLGKQNNYVGIHYLVAAYFGIIVLAQKLLDYGMDINVGMAVKKQVLMFVLAF